MRPFDFRYANFAKLVVCSAVALACAFVLFSDRYLILVEAAQIFAVWIVLTAALLLARRLWPSVDQALFEGGSRSAAMRYLRSDPAFFAAAITFLPAYVLTAAASHEAGERTRHLSQIAVFFVPLFLVLNIRGLLRAWRQWLLFAGTLAICVIVLWLAGPLILRRVILPDFYLGLQPAPKLAEGIANEDGVQPAVSSDQYRPQDFNVVFLGDSFTFGWGLAKQEQSFPFVIETLLKERFPDATIRVANFGRLGNSPLLELRQLLRLGATYKPDLVIQALDMTDFHNDQSYWEKLSSNKEMRVSFFHAMAVAFRLWLGITDPKLWLLEQLVIEQEDQVLSWLDTFSLRVRIYALLTGQSEEESARFRRVRIIRPPLQKISTGNPPAANGSGDDFVRRPFHDPALPVPPPPEGAPESRRKKEHEDKPPVKYYFPLWQPLEQSEPLLEITWKAILDTAAEAERLGARYALVVLPRYQQYNPGECPNDWEKDLFPPTDEYLLEPFKYFEKKAAIASFPIFSLLSAFRESGVFPTVNAEDGHYNAAGHRIVAEALVPMLLDARLLDGLTSGTEH